MPPRRSRGRALNGVLVLDKVPGMSSNQALQEAKRLFFAAKAGHTGTLDPLASGVLPLCFGEATKFSQFLLNSDKGYRSTFRFGVSTETGDSEGEPVSTQCAAHLSREVIEKAMEAYMGEFEQVPSMYSALKYQGQPLYKLARQGIEVERPSRSITVYNYQLLAFRPGVVAEADVELRCSKGTYVRCLAECLGRDLGVGAHVSALRRTDTGPFDESCAITLDRLREERGEQLAKVLDHHLLSVDAPLVNMKKLLLPESTGFYFLRGNPVMDAGVYRIGAEGDMVRVFVEGAGFVGVGEITDDGRIAPKRLVCEV